jgi:hypothetical protein
MLALGTASVSIISIGANHSAQLRIAKSQSSNFPSRYPAFTVRGTRARLRAPQQKDQRYDKATFLLSRSTLQHLFHISGLNGTLAQNI